jgi:hypothetical protein
MPNKRASRTNGRPSVFTNELLDNLEPAFTLGCSDREACLYADASPAALYKYQEKHPEFVERKEDLKESPVLLARESVNRGLKRDPKLAFDYLKARKRDEFADRQESTGKDGEPIQIATIAELVRDATDNNC